MCKFDSCVLALTLYSAIYKDAISTLSGQQPALFTVLWADEEVVPACILRALWSSPQTVAGWECLRCLGIGDMLEL